MDISRENEVIDSFYQQRYTIELRAINSKLLPIFDSFHSDPAHILDVHIMVSGYINNTVPYDDYF